MNRSTLHRRSLAHHARSHAVVALAVATGCAVLTGALLVGDSMRGSLRDMALRRLGPVDAAMIAPRFFRAAVGEDDLVPDSPARTIDTTQFAVIPGNPNTPVQKSISLMIIKAALAHAQTKQRVSTVNLYGIDGRFFCWFFPDEIPKVYRPPSDGLILLNKALASALDAKQDDDVLLYLEKQQLVPTETLLGRRDELGASSRLKFAATIPNAGWGGLDLMPGTGQPLNAFVSIETLQKILKQPGKANAILLGAAGPVDTAKANERLKHALALEDYDLRLRTDAQLGSVALETRRLLLEPPIENAALAAAKSLNLTPAPILTYLVNSIAIKGATPDHSITPYSVATAVESTRGMTLIDGQPAPDLGDNDILINSWTAEDLTAKTGDTLILKYFVSKPFGKLEEATAELKVAGIVKIEGLAADRKMTPEYEGITNTDRLSDWNPPFPMDMHRIRDKDEAYWKQYRGTPKAFVSLKTGERLWAEADPRYGRYTSIRLIPPAGTDLAKIAPDFEKALLTRIDPAQLGLRFEPVKAQALAASSGNTDFGMLFIGFSSFLIIAAMLLVALIFRLGIERRAPEIGLLLANGFNRRQVTGMMLAEGLTVAAVGTLLGLVAAIGYAKLMLAALRSWNIGSDAFPPLQLHATPQSLLIGGLVSFLLAAISIIFAIRGLTRFSARALLAGLATHVPLLSRDRRPLYHRVALLCVSLAIILCVSIATGAAQAAAFFGAGALLLIAGLSALRAWIAAPSIAVQPGKRSLSRLGIANARRNPGRSMLTAALIACATFVIIAVGANRQTVSEHDFTRSAGLGGFRLMAQSVIPIPFDLDTVQGRENAGLSRSVSQLLRGASIQSFRLQPGDDVSCLNLYQVRRPRILGASENMIRRGGFTFAAHQGRTTEEKLNPWILLTKKMDDGAIPAIGDANTIKWLLHRGLGDDLAITDERGIQRPLRIAGMLSHSALQGELIIGEDNFKKLFPSISGYSFFLLDTPAQRTDEIQRLLERNLAEHALDVSSTADRLAGYLAIENMYVSTFQLLGGLGLILGTIGLGVVMLRNVFERRRELALLRALGLRKSAIGRMVLSENLALLISGLLIGLLSAIAAITPHLLSQPATIPWISLTLTLLGVLASGLFAGFLVVVAAMRTPLLAGLRLE